MGPVHRTDFGEGLQGRVTREKIGGWHSAGPGKLARIQKIRFVWGSFSRSFGGIIDTVHEDPVLSISGRSTFLGTVGNWARSNRCPSRSGLLILNSDDALRNGYLIQCVPESLGPTV